MSSDADFNAKEIARMIRNINTVVATVDKAVADEAHDIGQDFCAGIQAIIAVPVFPRSLPGSPPHRESGRLSGLAPSFQASPSALHDGIGSPQTGYQFTVDRKGHGHYEVGVGSPQKYAKFLEGGTRYMDPRPHVEPVAKVIVVTIPGRVSAHVTRDVTAAIARMPRT